MKVNWFKIISGKAFFYSLLMEVFFLLLAFIDYPLRKIFADNSISPQNEMILHYFLAIFIGLFLIYFLIYKEEKTKNDFFKKNFKILIIFFIIFQITLLLIPPIGSADIYTYIFRAKILLHYHQNPFLVSAANFSHDPLINFTDKAANTIPLMYGPLWLIISIVPVIFSGNSIIMSVLLFKLMAIIFNCVICYFIFRILGQLKPNYQHFGTIMYAFNPLILFEIANNGHNDIAMIFFVILSIYYFIKGKYYFSFFALIFSVFIKYVTLILLPILILFIFNNLTIKRKKIKFIILSFIIFCSLLSLSYLVVGRTSGIKTIANMFYVHLLPPISFLIYLFTTQFTPKIQELMVKNLSNILFFIIYLYLLLFIFQRKTKDSFNLIIFLATATFFYLIVATGRLMPWYLIWFFPLAILIRPYLSFIIFLTGFIPICFYIFLYLLGYFFLFVISPLYFSFRKFYLKRLV